MLVALKAWQGLLAILFAPPGPARDRVIERTLAGGDALWSELISSANANLVSATLWSALVRDGLADRVPAGAAEYLAAFHAYNTARNAMILTELDECIGALNAAGLEPMPLKGSAYLLEGLYDDPGARFLTDIDLLIPADAAPAAQAALETLGLAREPEPNNYREHHHLAPMFRESDPAVVELHTGPVIRRAAPALPAAVLWADAQVVSRAGARFCLPSATDAALLSFLHAEIADRHVARWLLPLKSFYDLLLLERAYGAAIDWPRNRARAARIGAGRALRRYLGVLERISGIAAGPGTDEVKAATDEVGPRRGPERIGGQFARAGTVTCFADSLHFGLCAAAAACPAITRWVLRVERWSGRQNLREAVTPQS